MNPGEKKLYKSPIDPFDLLNPADLKKTIIKLLEFTGKNLSSEEKQWAENGDVEEQMIMAEQDEKVHASLKALHFYMLAANQGNGKAQAKAAEALFSIHRDTIQESATSQMIWRKMYAEMTRQVEIIFRQHQEEIIKEFTKAMPLGT